MQVPNNRRRSSGRGRGGNSRHDERNNTAATSTSTDSVPVPSVGVEGFNKDMYDRLLFISMSCVGWSVEVQVRNGTVYEGICHAATPHEKSGIGVVLKMARKRSTASLRLTSASDIDTCTAAAGDVVPSLIILPQDFVQMQMLDIDLSYATISPSIAFKTDTDISGARDVGERELTPWNPSEADGNVLGCLEESAATHGSGGNWDQFAANEKLFGVRSSFNELQYTTKIDKNDPKYRRHQANASRFAQEIIKDGANSTNSHIQEERGCLDDSGLDDEDRYGAVIRSSPADAATAVNHDNDVSTPNAVGASEKLAKSVTSTAAALLTELSINSSGESDNTNTNRYLPPPRRTPEQQVAAIDMRKNRVMKSTVAANAAPSVVSNNGTPEKQSSAAKKSPNVNGNGKNSKPGALKASDLPMSPLHSPGVASNTESEPVSRAAKTAELKDFSVNFRLSDNEKEQDKTKDAALESIDNNSAATDESTNIDSMVTDINTVPVEESPKIGLNPNAKSFSFNPNAKVFSSKPKLLQQHQQQTQLQQQQQYIQQQQFQQLLLQSGNMGRSMIGQQQAMLMPGMVPYPGVMPMMFDNYGQPVPPQFYMGQQPGVPNTMPPQFHQGGVVYMMQQPPPPQTNPTAMSMSPQMRAVPVVPGGMPVPLNNSMSQYQGGALPPSQQ